MKLWSEQQGAKFAALSADKSQTLGGDRGSPHQPNERSQVCANCPRDPYLSPAIRPISPPSGDTCISYFLRCWRECHSYFSAGRRSICSDTIPSLTSGEAGANIFLLLICFSRTLLRPINFPLWKDRIRPWHGSTPRLGFQTVSVARARFGKTNSHFGWFWLSPALLCWHLATSYCLLLHFEHSLITVLDNVFVHLLPKVKSNNSNKSWHPTFQFF